MIGYQIPEPLSDYFLRLFVRNPDWVESACHDLIMQRFREDHPGEEITPHVRLWMAIVKSLLRKKLAGGLPPNQWPLSWEEAIRR
jgi:hypothetical protein